jgi:CubicO group peptidase (beta-lactamase class C family)
VRFSGHASLSKEPEVSVFPDYTQQLGRPTRRRLLISAMTAAAAAAMAPPLASRAMAQTPVLGDGGEFDAFVAELDAMVQELMDRFQVPGVAVGVIADGKEHTAGFGVTNINHPLPIDADTLFQVGSITKTYTGTLIMRLVDDGLVELDAPVRTYLPDFQVADEAAAESVTVRQLLNHTAGWLGDVLTDTGSGADAIALYVNALVANPQIAPTGKYFSYSNSSFVVAGRLIEVVTGATYLESLTEHLLRPVGLERTYLYPEQIMTEVFVSGHVGELIGFAGNPVVARPWAFPRSTAPAGGVIASIADLMRYARFHLGDGSAEDGTVVLSTEAMAAFLTRSGPGAPIGDVIIDGVSVAWHLREMGGTLVLHHGGSTNGQEAHLVLVPHRQFALGILTNATPGLFLNSAVSVWALERYLGLAAPELTPVSTPAARLTEYIGSYSDGIFGTIELSEQNGELVGELRFPGLPPISSDGAVVFVGGDLVRLSIAPLPMPFLADFVRNDAGEVGWFRFTGRLQPRLHD